LNILQYTINYINLDFSRLLIPWEWLIGNDKEIVVITKMGDLVLKDSSDKLYFLSVTDGEMEHISNYSNDFFKNRLSAEQYYEIFQPKLIEDLEKLDDKSLKEGQVYAYRILPIKGGEIALSNISCKDIYEHFIATAKIHKELDGLPASINE
jgi:hypothetical protein